MAVGLRIRLFYYSLLVETVLDPLIIMCKDDSRRIWLFSQSLNSLF